jgi:hypothetical protein
MAINPNTIRWRQQQPPMVPRIRGDHNIDFYESRGGKQNSYNKH